jgi:exodeoxyribonuclease V alpha subunit
MDILTLIKQKRAAEGVSGDTRTQPTPRTTQTTPQSAPPDTPPDRTAQNARIAQNKQNEPSDSKPAVSYCAKEGTATDSATPAQQTNAPRKAYSLPVGKKKIADSKFSYLRVGKRAINDLDRVEKTVHRLGNAELAKTEDITDQIADSLRVTADSELVKDESQERAVNGLKRPLYGCIIGAAGTGKTTTLKRVVREIIQKIPTIIKENTRTTKEADEKLELVASVAFCAFTGRAVQNMKKALPEHFKENCFTIHRLLEYAPTTNDNGSRIFVPTRTATNPLPYKLIVIDEAGCCPTSLWNKLADALQDGTKVIFLGDINQLPPVGGSAILAHAMKEFRSTTYELTTIHRQSGESPIIENAHRVLQGKLPKAMKDFGIMSIDQNPVTALRQLQSVVKNLTAKGVFVPMRDMIITGQNIEVLGQESINEILAPEFNQNKRVIIQTGQRRRAYAVGDKVMSLKNDYEHGLMNGMLGIIEEIRPNENYGGKGGDTLDPTYEDDVHAIDTNDLLASFDSFNASDISIQEDEEESEQESERQASHIVKIRFMGVTEPVEISTAGGYASINLAYASTCHKMQGAETDFVIIVMHNSAPAMLYREWLYTAITRARKRVLILAPARAMIKAVERQRIKGRTLDEKIRSFVEASKTSTDELPRWTFGFDTSNEYHLYPPTDQSA